MKTRNFGAEPNERPLGAVGPTGETIKVVEIPLVATSPYKRNCISLYIVSTIVEADILVPFVEIKGHPALPSNFANSK